VDGHCEVYSVDYVRLNWYAYREDWPAEGSRLLGSVEAAMAWLDLALLRGLLAEAESQVPERRPRGRKKFGNSD